MTSTWRLLDSGLVPPVQSAALDEAILTVHTSGSVPNTLHFYVRSAPTISVGYFQKISETVDLDECRKRNVQIIRRKSGGSSIYTDRDQLIFALVVHENELPDDRTESFRKICEPVARAISSFGVEAKYRPMNDIEIAGKKLSGNAQLRRKGSVLQHGTVIVAADLQAMDAVLRLPGSARGDVSKPSDRVTSLASILGTKPEMKVLKSKIAEEISASFSVEFVPGLMTKQERGIVHELITERYSREEWNFRF
jgi:lipoate---protein ligase